MENLRQIAQRAYQAGMKAIWGEEFIADVGAVPLVLGPISGQKTRLTLTLVRVKGILYIKYRSPALGEAQVGYLRLQDAEQLQALLAEAVRRAAEAAVDPLSEGTSKETASSMTPRAGLQLAGFAAGAVLEALLFGLLGSALLLTFGAQALAIWLLVCLAGFLTGIVLRLTGSRNLFQLNKFDPHSLPVPRRLLVILIGVVIGVVVCILPGMSLRSPLEGQLRPLLGAVGEAQLGIWLGVLLLAVPSRVLYALRTLGARRSPIEVLEGINSGAWTGLLAAALIGFVGQTTSPLFLLALAGGIVGYDVFT